MREFFDRNFWVGLFGRVLSGLAVLHVFGGALELFSTNILFLTVAAIAFVLGLWIAYKADGAELFRHSLLHSIGGEIFFFALFYLLLGILHFIPTTTTSLWIAAVLAVVGKLVANKGLKGIRQHGYEEGLKTQQEDQAKTAVLNP